MGNLRAAAFSLHHTYIRTNCQIRLNCINFTHCQIRLY